jgi:hypothetical protein
MEPQRKKSNFRPDALRDRRPRLLAVWRSVWLTASAILGTPAFGGPQSAAVDVSSLPIHLRNPSDAKAVITRIDHDTAAIAAKLSPSGRRAYLASIQRLHAYASAHCGFYPGQKALEAGEDTCLLNIYDNFIVSIPGSVYQVGQWRVYETGVYGIELADDNLLKEDPDRPFWWDLELTWPRVDAESSPIPSAAQQALAERTRARISSWAAGGWSFHVSIRLTAINSCYVSAVTEESNYTGGAHPNEQEQLFNWNRVAQRELQSEDLFAKAPDWRAGLLQIYRRHLAAGSGADVAASLSDEDLLDWVDHGWVVTDGGVRIIGHEGRSRNETLPDADIAWSELGKWLLPGAACGSS